VEFRFGFRIFARDAASIVATVQMMDTMRLVTPMIWAMVSRSPGVSEKRTRCSARNIVGTVGSPPMVGLIRSL
jgi:hypothetical protein